MAKKRRFGFARKARSSAFRAAKYARRGTKAGRGQLIQVDALIYGAVRAPVSAKTQELLGGFLGGIPGGVGDEVAMGLINWLVAKNTSGMLRDVAVKGLVIENARIGEAAGQMLLGNISSGGTSSTFAYG